MRKRSIILPFILFLILLLILFKIDDITDYTVELINPRPKVVLSPTNAYTLNNDYAFVQKSKDYVPYSRQDIINIFYSFLDNGYDNFTFYCPSEYTDCIKDTSEIIDNQTLITDIGNFVHPFNNFHDVVMSTNNSGEVNLKITKTYSDDEIAEINHKIDEITQKLYTNDMDLLDKILAVHDYIIDSTEYDVDGSIDANAYDLFMNGKSKCFGYADAMSIILHRLGVKNFKVGSEQHVWNAVYLNDEWTQIDATWDDPVVENGANLTSTIRHKFYMIDTNTLLSYDTTEHNFNTKVYQELK